VVGGTIPVPCQPYTISLQFVEQDVLSSETVPVAAGEYGHFEYCGIPPGTYTMVVRGFNTLANLRADIHVPPYSP
jgi:hypothetical protein